MVDKEPEKKEPEGKSKEIVIKLPKVPKMSSKVWMYSAIFFFAVSMVLVLKPGVTGNFCITGCSAEDAAEEAVAWIQNYYDNSGADTDVILLSSSYDSDLGLVEFTIELSSSQGVQEQTMYASKNGALFIPQVISTEITESSSQNTQQETVDVPKSDVPVVELFIWGYCPYGVQAQGPLAEVVSILGDYADFKAVMYYDGHGAYETHQNKVQECIQQIAPEKYWDYAEKFVDEIYTTCSSERTVECDESESVSAMDALGIDSDEVLSCVDSQGEDLISDASSRASEVGVTGSPSLVINGVKVNVARNAESFKSAVCDAFNNPPEECSQELSGDTATASGSC